MRNLLKRMDREAAYTQGMRDREAEIRFELAPHITEVENELMMSHNRFEANEAVKALAYFRDQDDT